ncbi:glyoxalase [Nocardioides sp. TF02-7]|uniref:glyoxalase n=1 Tax=Nocardioides sp. TF02-7 TaxID=2917724 RepID=UPI001F054B3C|nr:glyoxalase [Nocardioides sp. TF02-7]UMG92125.1 glyoxalase [Nocardioides sp. TF02-7]
MPVIDHLDLGAADLAAAEAFYAALGVSGLVRVRAAETAPTGFEGFTLSFVLAQPGDVDMLVERALNAGATSLKPAKKSLWGYGAAFQAPDGTVCTVASSSKKDTAPATGRVDDVVLQLGVADVAATKRFYADRGFTVAKSFGRKYAELDTGPVTLTLNKPGDLAKAVGVSADGTDPARLVIHGDAGSFTDPDGFVWSA